MSDILAEGKLAQPLAQKSLDWFKRAGVPAINLAKRFDGFYSYVLRDEVVVDGDRFEFARYARSSFAVPRPAFVFAVFDRDHEPLDIVAWSPPNVATWLGRAGACGEEQICGPRLDDALRVHSSLVSWFAHARRGIYVLDPARLQVEVRNEKLGVLSDRHARELRASLTPKPPSIVVLTAAEIAA